MDKSDADLFTKLCSVNFNIAGITPLIYDSNSKFYNEHGIYFSGLSHLESIGLVHFNHLAGYIKKGLGQKGYINYFDKRVWIELPNSENNEFQLGEVIFTQIGNQLLKVCEPTPIEGYLNFVKEKWQGFGYKVYDKPPEMNA